MDSIHRRLLGESLREIGVLVLVFVPLDLILGPVSPSTKATNYPGWVFWLRWLSIDHWVTLFFAFAGAVLIYFGIKIEGKTIREEKGG